MSTASRPAPSKTQIREFRAIAHGLKPVVTVAGNGLSESVVKELERALEQHELIKVRIVTEDRELRQQISQAMCNQLSATNVQSIGKLVVLYRAARKADPRLSNVLRHKQNAD